MGLFDFFKRKDTTQQTGPEIPMSPLFTQISRYNEYIMRFLHMHLNGNHAPISAYESNDGEIIGFLYMIGEDKSYSLSAGDVLNKMEAKFEAQLLNNEIKSYVILYHSQFKDDNNHAMADNEATSSAISISYRFRNADGGKIALPYSIQEDKVSYRTISDFSPEENNIIFNTQLTEGKDYFQGCEEIKAPETVNSIGLKIKKSNNYDLGNMWGGIFGFEYYQHPDGKKALEEHFVLGLRREPVHVKGDLRISQLEYDGVALKTVAVNGKAKTFIPVVKTNNVFDVENKEINEWENVDNLEAVITGSGRDTFGLTYFATDYPENRDLYLSNKKHMISISGIAFVLDIYTNEPGKTDVPLSDDFTAYFPNSDHAQYGCFDFIGELEDFKETQLLESGGLKGYVLRVRLITNPDVENFFTIDMYVNPDNMRVKELTKGMKLTGMFQMQGRISK